MNVIQWLIHELLEDVVLVLVCFALPFVMIWAHLHRSWIGTNAAGDTVWLIRVVSPFLLPFAAYIWVLVISYAIRRKCPRFLTLVGVFLLTIAIEALCLWAEVWI